MRSRLAALSPADRAFLLLALVGLALLAYMGYSYTTALNQQDEWDLKLRRYSGELSRLRAATDISQLQAELAKLKTSLSSTRFPSQETAAAVATVVVNEADREGLTLRSLRAAQGSSKLAGKDYSYIRFNFVVSGNLPQLTRFLTGLEEIPLNSLVMERLVTEKREGGNWESKVDILTYFERGS